MQCHTDNTGFKFYTFFLSGNYYLYKSGNACNAPKRSNYSPFKPLLHWGRDSIQTFLSEKNMWKFSNHLWQAHTKSTVSCHFPLFVFKVGGMLEVEGSKPSAYYLPVFLSCPTGSWGKKVGFTYSKRRVTLNCISITVSWMFTDNANLLYRHCSGKLEFWEM